VDLKIWGGVERGWEKEKGGIGIRIAAIIVVDDIAERGWKNDVVVEQEIALVNGKNLAELLIWWDEWRLGRYDGLIKNGK